ncbi:MAG TPA: 23S rRNA (guanosine(2251)-2'-O)-methyltransferase RlmB [Acidimicrobiales bacterium]
MTRRGPSGRERTPWGEHIEGPQAVGELLRAGKRRVHRVLVSEGSGQSAALAEIARLARAAGVPVRTVDRPQLLSAAQTDAPQGVVAVADPVDEADLEDLSGRRAGDPAPFLVVLDGVTDPHNLGAVMRTAACAGASGIVIGRHRAAGLTPSAVKAAAGAVEHLPVAPVAGIPNALSSLAAAGVWTVALDPGATGSLWDLQVATEPVALVLGSEGKGISRLARERCELAVSIPLSGPIASLNVSAAAALACFEVARRRSTQPD